MLNKLLTKIIEIIKNKIATNNIMIGPLKSILLKRKTKNKRNNSNQFLRRKNRILLVIKENPIKGYSKRS